MNDVATKLVIDVPKSDLVFVFSASWFVWVGLALVLVAVILALLPKKEPKP